MKKIFETIIKNRWYLHSLTFPIDFIVMLLIDKKNFLYLGDAGTFLQFFVVVFTTLCVSWLVEWSQMIYYYANKTTDEQHSSNGDILVGVIMGTLGAITYLLFN